MSCFFRYTWEENTIAGVLHAITILGHALGLLLLLKDELIGQVLIAHVRKTLLFPTETAIELVTMHALSIDLSGGADYSASLLIF